MSLELSRRHKELAQAIKDDQAELHSAIDDLKVAVARTTSPRALLGERPWVSLGVAFAVGLVLGGLHRPAA